MAKLPILLYPHPLLSRPTRPVTEFNSQLHSLIESMFETMYTGRGVGLAAPQVGLELRLTVVDVSEKRNERIELINPEIISRSGKISYEEGCLSIPGYRDFVDRSEKVKVKALDRHGKPFEVDAEELFAVCLQHEIDHLDGILFIDRLSRLKKALFKKWFKKKTELGEYPP